MGTRGTLSALFFCFKRSRPHGRLSDETSDDLEAGRRLRDCVFCNVSSENGFNIVFEDENFAVFTDHKPSAVHHWQVIPKAHITSVRSLRKHDLHLVRTLGEIGHRFLDESGVPSHLRKLGFHIPPFNSVNHLHLHVQALPYTSIFGRVKYPVVARTNGRNKGFSWFSELAQTIHILERDGRVGVFPC
ncbi:hypothetical protein JAAARDRAFT_127632 [Jaapia argillacea MUCL 33604]|uniref:HIT domain-containing protein n=1 Tax=Jaapia argillacea MUCL 33604 TaxID=933084 RepID=A0A067Q977_9AGAM|nr:hypothetical protein JAAARDRAFT_127632 [Jaapia argillacea MUCL 33604]